MAKLVVNDIVKLDWDADRWLATSGKKGKRSVFICASQGYETENGLVDVFFTSNTAFVFEDEEGLYPYEDLYASIKAAAKEGAMDFPMGFDEYVPIIESGENECTLSVLEKYGLTQYKDDIEARKKDLEPYGIEEIMQPPM